jgi:hypothetical protein
MKIRSTIMVIAGLLLCSTSRAQTENIDSTLSVIGLAQSCDNTTPPAHQMRLSVEKTMARINNDYSECIVRNTRVDLVVTGIQAYENKWKAGSLRISFAKEHQGKIAQIITANVGKKLVLLQRGTAITSFKILEPRVEKDLLLQLSSLSDAQALQAVLKGDRSH